MICVRLLAQNRAFSESAAFGPCIQLTNAQHHPGRESKQYEHGCWSSPINESEAMMRLLERMRLPEKTRLLGWKWTLPLLIMTLYAGAALATIFGTVQGVVHDPDHRPVAGAMVMLKSANSSWSQTTTTDENGEFRVQAVPIGEYVIAVSAKGFDVAKQKITVLSGTAPVLHFPLAIAALNQKVVVSGTTEAPNVETVTPTTMVNRAQISQTPGADRANSLQMITDFVPGAYITHDQLHIRGGHQVSWLIDGVPIPNTNIASNLGPQIDPQDIDYLEVQRGSYDAE